MFIQQIVKFYTVNDLCDYFGVTRQAVSRWINDGKVNVSKTPSGRIRISEEEFNRITEGGV